VNRYSVELVDVNYAGASWKYGILWMKPEDPAVIRFVDSATMTSSAVYSYGAGVKTVQYSSDFIFTKTTNDFQILLYSTAVLGNVLTQFNVDGAGTWTLIGVLAGRTTWPSFSIGAYHPSEDVLYYYKAAVSDGTTDIESVPRDAAGAATSVLTSIYFRRAKSCMIYGGGDIYTATRNALLGNYDLSGTLYSIASNTPTVIDSEVYSQYSALLYQGNLFGIDPTGTLYQYHTVINMYTQTTSPEDTTVRDYCSKMLRAYNLIGIISSHKKGFVYRRGNDSGDIQTTGNNMTLNITNVSDILQVQKAIQKVALVTVTNGTLQVTYNGTTFDTAVLSEVRQMSVSNTLIPTGILKDVAYYFYQFYKTDRDKYTFNVDAALTQYEVMDGASVTFSTTKISKTATGLITAQTINPNGSMIIEVLF
jgi:hypothetical protein